MTVIIFIIVLAVLIFVHELGHFAFSKAFGIRVDAFALGFGPKIVSWKKGETEYAINWIPFGGYVKIHGENPDEESTNGPDSARSFVNKTRWKQVIVLGAGIAFNFIFAWLLYTAVFTSGVTATPDGFEQYAADFTNSRIMITDVSPGSPAEKAGLKMGDVVRQVALSSAATSTATTTFAAGSIASRSNGNSDQLTTDGIQAVTNSSQGKPLAFTYSRGSTVKTVQLSPVSGLVPGKYAIGIAMDKVADLRLPFFSAIKEGFNYTIGMIEQTAIGLYGFVSQIFQGTADFSQVSGPVGIAGIVGNAAELGFTYLIMITALISINLGVINLIPFPALDGGRILFVIIEAIIRRRIPAKFTNVVNTVGFVALMILMVVVTYKDIAKLVMK